MRTPTPDNDISVRSVDRVLSYVALGLIALSVILFFVVIIATGVVHVNFNTAFWHTISATVLIAPTVGFLLILTVLIMSFVRRSRANKAH